MHIYKRIVFLTLFISIFFISSGVVVADEFPESYIVWWPGNSSGNTKADISREMQRMVDYYHPKYIYILFNWIDLEPRPNEYNFRILDLIQQEAEQYNIDLIIMVSTEAYGGGHPPPFAYTWEMSESTNHQSWFWKHTRPDGTEYGLYDPLQDAMRFSPTCGCNCDNEEYGLDKDMTVGAISGSDHVTQTCDGVEKVYSTQGP